MVYTPGINHLEWFGNMGVPGVQEALELYKVNCLGFIAAVDAFAWTTGRGHTTGGGHLPTPNSGLSSLAPLSILAISSDAGEREMRTSAAYCASKAALNSAVRVAARELGPSGVAVNALAPGMLAETGMTKQMDRDIPHVRGWTLQQAQQYEYGQQVVPLRIQPRHVAAVVYNILTSPLHLNGEIVTMDGGR